MRGAWIVRCFSYCTYTSNVEGIKLMLRYAHKRDAARDLAKALKENRHVDYYDRQFEALMSVQGHGRYWAGAGPEIELMAQRNCDRENSAWYGLRVGAATLDSRTICALRRIVGCCTPDAAITALRAAYVEYDVDIHNFVEAPRPEILDHGVPRPTQPAPETETATAS